MSIKKEIEIGGAKYVYVSPDDFTFKQFKTGKKFFNKILPLIAKAQGKTTNDGTIQVSDSDLTKVLELMKSDDEGLEFEIVCLCYVNVAYKKFNEADYKISCDNIRKEIDEYEMRYIDELMEVLPPFFTYTMPRMGGAILTSMGKMQTQTESEQTQEMQIENTEEQTES